MKKLTFIFFLLILPISVFAQDTWVEDPAHSKLGFTVTHLGIADVPGYFGDYDVTIEASEEDFSDAKVELTVQTASIDTRVKKRNNHLKSPDFFNVEKYPTMTFKSTGIKEIADDKYELTGDLTLLGITKPVTVTMLYRGNIQNDMTNGALKSGIQITGTIDRSEFDLGGDFPPPMISNQVRIKADGEFTLKK
ncbi:polyisoprenoid-binding protein [Aliifodinibius salipaludis]|uniref:Polyisoprenoid-binding protein n=1 Tax=Fodinibius salipaludis TaxID=2032627 RepID=A0A2A2GD27_9BACT|nr:YceI family protein [Aliifodinibius salipaludis]PAU94803.1 polyisoprenoid-binding protein [Aliifodinibius salipaludis]